MKALPVYLIFLFSALIAACGGNKTDIAQNSYKDTIPLVDPNDSALYGMACDGFNDTILIVLRSPESDPDTFNILNATRRHRIFGSLHVGDKVAIVQNRADSTVADIVIDIETLRATWCYEVMPTVKLRADMGGKSQSQLLREMQDSVRQQFMVAREYGFTIKGEHSISPVFHHDADDEDEESPVEYAPQRHYRDWSLLNGDIILAETGIDSLGQTYVSRRDTATFLLLNSDSLALRFNSGVQGYYRKR